MKTAKEELARRLRAAYVDGPVAPLRDGLDPQDADGAYQVQHLNTQFWREAGRKIVGRKIGLTSKAVQEQLGVTMPDFGVLFDDMAIDDHGELSSSRVLQPKAEAEIAFVMGKDLHRGGLSSSEIAAAVDHVLPAIEIVDSRVADWKITFADTVADNGSSAFFVLGREPQRLKSVDLQTCGMVLEQNGQLASMGVGAACLGSPINAAAWLLEELFRRGESVSAGDVLLTGALGPMVALRPGAVIEARIGGLGRCGFKYVEQAR
jgi:2-keto-4-pentenoate hydratase